MLQRFGTGFILMFTIVIILAFCITEDKAGVILRNFKSRRMIMEELEEEEKAVKARLSLNLPNATNASTETLKTANLIDQKYFNNTENNSSDDDLAVELKNISKSIPKKSLKVTSKQKITQKSLVSPQIKNKTSLRMPNTLTNSFVEYLETRGRKMEDQMMSSENEEEAIPILITQKSMVSPQIKNKTSLRMPNTLTNSFVEYLETRGRRMEDQMLSSENDEEAIPILISTNETNESSPFRLITQANESIVKANEISETFSPTETVDLESKEMSEVDLEKKVKSIQENGSNNLKDSDLEDRLNIENEQLSMKNITDIMKEIKDTSSGELPKNSFPKMSPGPQANDSIPEKSDSKDLGNTDTENHVNSSELIPFNDTISVQVEEQFKNLSVDTTNENSEKLLDDEKKNNELKEKETKNNESSTTQISSEAEEDATLKPFEESSDIIEEAAKEISEIIPASNETLSVENIEVFVANLTDAVQNMSDEEIMDLEPEDEHINQPIPNEIPAMKTVEKDNASTIIIVPENEQISQSISNEIPATEIVEKDNTSTKIINDTAKEFELSLESVVSSGLDFIVNSEVAKNAAIAMEVFNLSDSSLTDHVIEDTDMHSFIDIMMPSASIDEIESISNVQKFISSDETTTSSQSVEVVEVSEKKSELDTNPKFNESLVNNNITNSILEDTLVLDPKPNSTSAAERKCPTPGICVFWFMARDTCSDHTQCLEEKMCCRVRCSKSCIDI